MGPLSKMRERQKNLGNPFLKSFLGKDEFADGLSFWVENYGVFS